MSAAAYDVKQTHVTKALPHGAPLVTCRFHPAGKLAFAGSQDRQVVRWDLATGTKVVGTGHESWVFALAFVAGGREMVSAAGDGRLIWWNAADPQLSPVKTVQAHDGWARCLAASADGQLLASGGNDNRAKVWSADGKPVHTLAGHVNRVYSVAFHPDGKHLLSGDLRGSVRVWELASGKEVGAFDAKELHTYEAGQGVDFGGIRGLCVSRDSQRVACGGLHKASNPLGNVHEPLVLIFDWTSRKKLSAHTAPGLVHASIWRLHYLPDNTVMGVCGGNSGGLLLFWKADQEKDLHRFKLPGTAHDFDLHPTEPVAVTAHHDGNIRLCRLAAKV